MKMIRGARIAFALMTALFMLISLFACSAPENDSGTGKTDGQAQSGSQTAEGESGQTDKSHKLTFISDGFDDTVIDIRYGEVIDFPSLSRGDEYTFMYWKDKETGEKITVSNYYFDQDKTFIAVWEANWSQGF